MILCASTSPTIIAIAPDGRRYRFVETSPTRVHAIAVDGTHNEWIHRVWLLRWTTEDVLGLHVFHDEKSVAKSKTRLVDDDEYVIAFDVEDAQHVAEDETGEMLHEPFKHPGERWVQLRDDRQITIAGVARTCADWVALRGRSYLASRA